MSSLKSAYEARVGEMDLNQNLSPIITVTPSHVEDGVALTIGTTTIHMTRLQTIHLRDELTRVIVCESISTAQLDVMDHYGFRDKKRPSEG